MDLIAKVSFFDDSGEVQEWRKYDYFTLDEDLKEGNLVVVETRNGYKVASFVEYTASSDKATSYIITSVDLESVKKHRERKKEKEELLHAIKKREEELTQEKRLRELAEEDETMKELVDKYFGE